MFAEITLLNAINVNSILIPLMIVLSIVILFYFNRLKRINDFYKFRKVDKLKKSKDNKSILGPVKEKLYMVLLLKNKEKRCDSIFNAYLIVLFIVFLTSLYFKSMILAICIPVLTHVFVSKILDEMIVGFDIIVRKNFTTLINHIVKVFSTTNDLGIVLYESSKEIEEPLRTLILTLSREIMVDNSEQKLIGFIEKTDNLWLHSFILTLLNYKENSSKENVISNLLNLSDMIEKRNQVSEKMINDRKPIVIMNYMVLGVGLCTFIINLAVNPMMKEFLLSTMGTGCLLAGLAATLGTVLINMKLVKY